MEQTVKDRINILRDYYKLGVQAFESHCGLSNGYISHLKAEAGTSKVQKIIEAFPEVSLVWLVTGEGDMFKTDIPMRPDLPLDYSAAAGFTEDLTEGLLAASCPMQPVYYATPDYDLTITTRGDSMEPLFLTGDKLCLKRCADFVMWGAPHVLDTAEGIYLKRIYDEGADIRCVSENSEYNDFTIPKSSIRGIYRVVALHRIC